MFSARQHTHNSSLRENIVEHQFIAATLKALWGVGIIDAEILRSEFDGYGYDLVLSRKDVVRHIQLKSGLQLTTLSAPRSLALRPSGCVLFIKIDDQLNMNAFYFFGSSAGQPLPEVGEFATSKRATANSQGQRPLRSNHCDIPKAKFQKLASLEAVMSTLLGEPLASA